MAEGKSNTKLLVLAGLGCLALGAVGVVVVGGGAGLYYYMSQKKAAEGDAVCAKAIACWEQALKMEPQMTEAVFNIAVANERLGNLQGAKTYYKRYIKEIEDPEEVQSVEDHLSTLGK